MKKDETILVNLSGRGDKDMDFVLENYPLEKYEEHEEQRMLFTNRTTK